MGSPFSESQDYADFWCLDIPSDLESVVDGVLTRAASPIQAALAAVDALNCTRASWAAEFLKQLNVRIAAIFYKCPCTPKFTDAQRAQQGSWIMADLAGLRNGTVDICAGATGRRYPAAAYVQRSWTDWSEARMMVDTAQRG